MLTNVKTSKYGFRIHSDPNGEYTVNAVRRLLEYKFILYKCLFICWSKLIPLKVRCFIWRTSLGRIPVDNALMVRGNTLQILFSLYATRRVNQRIIYSLLVTILGRYKTGSLNGVGFKVKDS